MTDEGTRKRTGVSGRGRQGEEKGGETRGKTNKGGGWMFVVLKGC